MDYPYYDAPEVKNQADFDKVFPALMKDVEMLVITMNQYDMTSDKIQKVMYSMINHTEEGLYNSNYLRIQTMMDILNYSGKLINRYQATLLRMLDWVGVEYFDMPAIPNPNWKENTIAFPRKPDDQQHLMYENSVTHLGGLDGTTTGV